MQVDTYGSRECVGGYHGITDVSKDRLREFTKDALNGPSILQCHEFGIQYCHLGAVQCAARWMVSSMFVVFTQTLLKEHEAACL